MNKYLVTEVEWLVNNLIIEYTDLYGNYCKIIPDKDNKTVVVICSSVDVLEGQLYNGYFAESPFGKVYQELPYVYEEIPGDSD